MSDESKSGDLIEAKQYSLSPVEYREKDSQLMSMIDSAVNNKMTASEIEKLMDLHERWQKNQARNQFIMAMSEFKASAPKVTKDQKVKYKNNDGSFTEYEFCSLANMTETLAPAMAANGISHNWLTDQSDGVIKVTCVVTHASGHQVESTLISTPDNSGGKNGIQSVGSTITYLKRYTFQAATGVAVHDMLDDDGQGAGKRLEEGDRPDTRQFISDDYFEKNFPGWEKVIKEGRNTKEGLINHCEQKGLLTDAQRKKINDIEIPAK